MTDDLAVMGARLHARLVATFPELEGVRLSRAWSGYCAGTFDLWPHVGVDDGIHYAMGYCYAGLPMGTWLGYKVAAHILGRNDRHTAFAQRHRVRGASVPHPARVPRGLVAGAARDGVVQLPGLAEHEGVTRR